MLSKKGVVGMALIKCKECSKEISDKEKILILLGVTFWNYNRIYKY